jgi:hypothetical protein
MSAIRDVFLKKVQSRFFGYLKAQPMFKDYKSSDLWKLSTEIVETKSAAIDRFLDEKKYALNETDAAIEATINEVLVPEISKLRI